MILTFKCSEKLKERIDELLKNGSYSDFSVFCQVALENQLLLEESHLTPNKSSSHPRRDEKSIKRNSETDWPEPETNRTAPPARTERPSAMQICVPAELLLTEISENPPVILPDPSPDLFTQGQTVPVDRWLFGQFNRLLPAKVSIRSLAVIASREGKEALNLESASTRVAETASAFGDFLRQLDVRFGAHRDDAVATAFPDSGPDGQKGRLRYQNHFVGHTVKGEQGGLLVGLKLATIQVSKNKPYILPTMAGWALAVLENPILDKSPSDSPARFSAAEIDFLLRHIKDCVPVERFAYFVTLDMLAKGICSPEAMNTELLRLLSPGRDSEETKEFVNTQRSGVLGRMTDLGLIAHDRNGRNVSRLITPEGKRFLDTIGNFKLATGV